MEHGRDVRPEGVLKNSWNDSDAHIILRAAQSPMGTTDTFPQIQSTKVLPMLAPDAASSRLLAMGYNLSLDGIATLRIPFISGAGRPTSPAFIAESAPIPIVDLSTSAMTLGPTRKIAIGCALSMELQEASAETASAIIAEALSISATQALDSALFSANPATAIAPAGLLFGVPPIASAGGTGAPGVAADFGLLATAISAAGVEVDNLVIVCSASLGAKAKVLAGPHFIDRILTSGYFAAGTVVALNPLGLATGFSGVAEIETSTAAPVHMDTSPLAIGTPGSPPTVAAETLSAWQSGLVLLKIRAKCAWCIEPAAIAVVTGADW
jgi:hypothetical protein